MRRMLFMFPGQGAQYPGMLGELGKTLDCRLWFDRASEALGEDVAQLDTPEALKRTRAVQLCILVAGAACADWLMREEGAPDFVSGLSIGAFPAAVVSGALGFEEAVRLVSLRGELMENACPAGYGLSAVGGLPERVVAALVKAVHSPDCPVFLANFNAADQFVIAGADEAMRRVLEKAREAGATVTERLAVAVPSHCPLLEEASLRLGEAMRRVSFKRPSVAYLSGSTGRVLWQPERIADDLAGNMARPVRWADAMTAAYERGVRLAVEMPPGSVLTGLAKRVMDGGEALACDRREAVPLLGLIRRLRCG
ncbi:MAG: malonate decarboxylase subunit epsilon [Alistipes senegalensis]|nr:malonate decarboxylase subunit epsilon [Oxalobacter formigenes]MCM1280697.1 malonate decarboxylase subunit epsilon [Alistipes senegalensis]